MAERPGVSLLNENQVRHLLGVLSHVEDLLASVEAMLRPPGSPFARVRADVDPEEARLLSSFVALARRRMADACDRLGVPRPSPATSARWSVETALDFADISFVDLEPPTMRGYGPLPAPAAAELAGVAQALQQLMRRGVALLHASDGLDLAKRAEAVPGATGEALRALERLVSRHGLVEIRPLLAAAVDRALTATFDVGVFGRVSNGKSSLLDALLGADALPVGATPVTAVPLLVSHGAARLEVHLARGEDKTAPVEELSEYATEEHNPDNEKGVSRIELFLPIVPERLRFLDTPGVGSLSTSGPSQAFAALPRCDLGLVLVAAGSPVGSEDVALVSGLARAGLSCHLLLSKCDLLGERDRTRALAYVRSELDRALGPGHGVTVRAVSTRPGFELSMRALRTEVLDPAASRHLRSLGATLERRVRALIAAIDAALAGRRSGLEDDVLAERARDRARRRIRSITALLAATSADMLASAVDRVASAWSGGDDARAAALDALRQPAALAQEAVRRVLDEARAELGVEETEARVPPLFDPGWLDSLPGLTPPAIGRRLAGRPQAAHRLAGLAPALQKSLSLFGARLASWAEGALGRMRALGAATAGGPARDAELARIEALLAPAAVLDGQMESASAVAWIDASAEVD